MKNTLVVIQKDSTRYVMYESRYNSEKICIETHIDSTFGESVHKRYVRRNEANEMYVEMINKGFRRFRSIHEVSWYATADEKIYRPSSEPNWKTEGIWFIPYTEVKAA